MSHAVKKTISLPAELASQAEEAARLEGKTLSAIIQEALLIATREKLKDEFARVQGYWSQKAREKGIVTARDLKRYLAR
jgi:hypothetical protein